MPDLLIRGIDSAMAERIKALARDNNWSINDVILGLLKQALGLSKEGAGNARPHQDIALMAGTWDQSEAAAFRAAVEAFERLPTDPEPFAAKPDKP